MISEVPSEIVSPSEPDRRTRKREARRQDLLDLALDLSEELGVEGVTMTALAEAADYAPASLYTYFPSHSALVASMQTRALNLLGGVAETTLQAWDLGVAARPTTLDPTVAALARLWVFGDLFLTAPETHAREFRLQQQLLASPHAESPQDAATVLPAAMSVLDRPRRLLADAVTAGALEAPRAATDPIDHPLDGDVLRTLAWVTALNGALLVDGLDTGVPTTGAVLGAEITRALLRGWGADPVHLDDARTLSQGWVEAHA
jgi:AcrR family transcriptional regulator